MELIKKIEFQNLESIPLLIKDFLNQKLPDFEEHVFSLSNFRKAIAAKQNSFSKEKRETFSFVLKEQLANLKLSEKQQLNLKLIAQQNTFSVTTGHQLNLFSGPVYFIYKILQTIKTAQFLNENFPENNIVPIFWMASEDHDFEEINHFRTENKYYEINEISGGAVGKIKLTRPNFIEEFEKEFKDSVFGTELILILKEAYFAGNSLAEATKTLVNRLFGDFGLLIIDGDHPLLKSEIKETFEDELLHETLKNATQNKVNFLTKQYGKVQVNPREINLFYLTETRNRIEKKAESYIILDKNIPFYKEEILTELHHFPEKFSPNALMRPVFQETILPNLAYIGGNAEIMYWLELKDYFEKIHLPFPILIPRNSFLFVKEKSLKKAEKLNLNIEDFFKNFAQISTDKLLENNEIIKILDKNEIDIKENFEELKTKAEKTDPTFGNLVKAEEIRQLKSFKRMKKRLLRAEKIKKRELLERLENVFLEIHPSKNWQERVCNFSIFYADEGKKWLEICLKNLDVQRSELIIIAN